MAANNRCDIFYEQDMRQIHEKLHIISFVFSTTDLKIRTEKML